MPRQAKRPATTTTTQMIAIHVVLALPMKSNLTFCIRLRVIGVVRVMPLKVPFLRKYSITRRVANTAVKNEQQIPTTRVTAKPRIGPEPRMMRMMPVIIDVKLESKIAEKALL